MEKEFKRMTRNYNNVYEEGRKRHRWKIDHLEKKYSKKPTVDTKGRRRTSVGREGKDGSPL